jgi:large subunit ribosomal protein L7Ae
LIVANDIIVAGGIEQQSCEYLTFDATLQSCAEEEKMSDEAKILEAVEIARTSGKIKKGANEATKAIEKGNAKLVVYASDCSPKEIIMHLPLLCKEKNVPCFEVSKKEDLGAAVGLALGTAAVAVVKEGEAKSAIESLAKDFGATQKAKEPIKEVKEEPKKAEESKQDAKDEVKEEAPAPKESEDAATQEGKSE